MTERARWNEFRHKLLLLSVCNYTSIWLKTFTGPHLNPWWQTAIIMQIHKHCASDVDVLDYTGRAKLDGSTKRSTVLHDEARRCFYTAAFAKQRAWEAGTTTNQEPQAAPLLVSLMPIPPEQYCELWCRVKKAKMPNTDLNRLPDFSPWCLFDGSIFWQFDSQKPAICLELSASVQQELVTELRKKNKLINWCCK